MYVMNTDYYCNLQNPNKFLDCPGGIWAKTPLDVFPGKKLPILTPNLPQFPRKRQTSTAKFNARETEIPSLALLAPSWAERRHRGCRAAAESSVVWPRARSQAAPPGLAQAPPTRPRGRPAFVSHWMESETQPEAAWDLRLRLGRRSDAPPPPGSPEDPASLKICFHGCVLCYGYLPFAYDCQNAGVVLSGVLWSCVIEEGM